MTPLVTLALIGAGRWGTNIRRTIERLPAARLVAVRTREWRDLLRRDDLDGVLIATPASTHAHIALPFIERGISTFIEKPLTVNLPDALRLQRVAARRRALVFVGHVHLYNPAYQTLKSLLPHLGRIRWVLGEGMNNGPFRDDISCLWDWAPHDLAMALDLFGETPTAVRASGTTLLRPKTRLHDVATLELRFPQGKRFLGVYSWLAPEKRKKLTVVGARDTIVFDDAAEHKVSLYERMGPTVRRGAVTRQEPRATHPPYADTPSLTAELSAFLAMIRTKRPPPSPLAQGLQTIEILDAAERSMAAGGREVQVRATGAK